jgi:hypothetical protein
MQSRARHAAPCSAIVSLLNHTTPPSLLRTTYSVFGPCLADNNSPVDGHRKIDVHLSAWSGPLSLLVANGKKKQSASTVQGDNGARQQRKWT